MLKVKERKAPAVLKSWDDVNNALCQIGKNIIYIDKKGTELKQNVQSLKDSYNRSVEPVIKENKTLTDNIEKYCDEHKKDFVKPRSKKFLFGTIGYRLNPGRIEALYKKISEKVQAGLLKVRFKRKYLRIEYSVNYEKLLADARKGKVTPGDLHTCGLKFIKGEEFFCEPNLEELETVSKN